MCVRDSMKSKDAMNQNYLKENLLLLYFRRLLDTNVQRYVLYSTLFKVLKYTYSLL